MAPDGIASAVAFTKQPPIKGEKEGNDDAAAAVFFLVALPWNTLLN